MPQNSTSVVAALHQAILRGDYAPRQRLVETDLVELYGASRFIIRDALKQLAGEGLVEIQPNKGARIREVSVREALEITEVRRVVEGLVAARAATLATAEDIRTLKALGKAMETAVQRAELLRYSDLNAELHAALRSIAKHESATRIIEQLNGQLVRHQFMLSLVPGRSGVSLDQHLDIIAAVVARDPEAAEAAMHTHIDSVIALLAQFTDASPQPTRSVGIRS